MVIISSVHICSEFVFKLQIYYWLLEKHIDECLFKFNKSDIKLFSTAK